MKNFILKSAVFGLIIGIIFCIVCINLFESNVIGITLGTGFSIPFFVLSANLFSKDENNKKIRRK